MICKELKNISGNIFGFKKRLSVGKMDNDDRIPLTEAIFKDQMQSSQYYNDYKKDELVEKSTNVHVNKILSEDFTKSHNNSPLIIEEEMHSEKTAPRNISPEKQYPGSTNVQEFQEDWSFTWYDFDGRGKITRKDMSTMMKSLYDIIRHNTKNRNSRFINHYKLHLVLMTKDISNVQGLDLATSYEQIYQMDSVMTSLTNLTLGSSDEDDPDSDNTIGNNNINQLKPSKRKSFSGRCFEELNEMRARKIEKRSKSTPTDHHLPHKRKETNCENAFKKEHMSISTSMMSLAGSSPDIRYIKPKLRRERTKSGKSKTTKRTTKTANDILRNKTLLTSYRNIANSSDCLDRNISIQQKHVKTRNKQQRKKDLGRKQVEDWLQIDGQKENTENLTSDLQLIHHHYHHYHQSSCNKTTNGLVPIQFHDSDWDKCLNNELSDSRSQQFHHHVHLHHHHHHYFY